MIHDHLANIRNRAQEGIARRLFADANASDAELRALGTDIATACGGIAVFGAIKEKGRAAFKVGSDYGGDWYQLKDAVRMIIVAPDAGGLKQVQAAIRTRCVPSNKLGIIKDQEALPHTSPCGFSGVNFVITLSNGRPAEIQANIAEVMFGQMSAELFRETLGETRYQELRGRFRIPGGMGHGLYEIYRVAPTSENARKAAALSREYFNYLRGKLTDVNALQAKLTEVARANPRVFHV